MTRGERVIAFIERYCRVPEGKHVGKPIKLSLFQKKFILAIFDNPDAITTRAYLSLARKNGKTALIAAILLAFLVGPEATQNSQIISGARSREQAALIFALAEKMVRLNSELSVLVKIVPSKKQLIGLPMNVEYRAVSAEAGTAHGLSPILAILDEVGQVRGPTDAFVEAIETAQGAHENPLLVAISTQAATDADLFSVWLDDAINSEDPRIVCHLYTAEEDCDVMDEKAWAAANPALGEFRMEADLRQFAEQAERIPSKENSFRWLYLNQRIEAQSPFLNRGEWNANNSDPQIELLAGQPCFAGLDLSAKRDLTAFVMAFQQRDQNGEVFTHIVPRFYLPGDGIIDRSREDKVPYDLWAKQGFLTLIDGPTIDPEVIAREIAECCELYDMQKIAYDRWRIDDLKRELDKIGIWPELVPHGQGYKDMSPAVDELERLVVERKLRHGGNPLLNMAASGAIVDRDPAGNRKLNKAKSSSRIDGLVALAMALSAQSKDGIGDIPPSPWEDPNFSLSAA